MDIIKNEGVFRLFDKGGGVTLTDERQLERIIEGPDTPLFVDEERGFGAESKLLNGNNQDTLRSRMEEAEAWGSTRMSLAYDFFFGGTERHNYPSDDITVKAFKAFHDAAKEHGMSFEASVLSPLDVGGGWIKQSDETGFSYQFQETGIAADGSYSVDMVCQRQWYNNKGPIKLTPHKVLVFAFNETRVGNTPYFYVDENAILDISATAECTIEEDKAVVTGAGYGHCPMRIFGKWENPTANRALCVMVYRTPELDYFADSAHTFMKQLLDQHNAAGISYGGFYSDEMHIQFDWDLETHFGETELTVRYLTPNLAKKYAALYGEQYLDFPKYLVYMAYHQHDFLPGEEGKEPAQHVFGTTPEDINRTWLFRNRYFELLQRTVVDLANESKAYAEQLWGGPIMTRAHATWQEAPSCDHEYKRGKGGYTLDAKEMLGDAFDDVNENSPVERRAAMVKARAARFKELGISRYDYTPWYDWSSSIRENISACYDYFKWNEFLSGGGTDHAEGGFLDRNYFAQAMAASFSELNKFGLAYCAGWGMPANIHLLLDRMANAYGNAPWDASELSFVNGLGTRRTDVLMMYPIKLNNVEERFGSWMVQYGYCNYITEEKLLENATVCEDGTLVVNGQHFRCLVACFEPFMDGRTFDLIEKFLAVGGKVLWMSVPATSDNTGADASARFGDIFGLKSVTAAACGEYHKGESVHFTGRLAGIKDMPILNDYLVDMVWPCEAGENGEAVAAIGGKTVAVARAYAGGGLAVYAGFRLRDDQSCSLGEDIDTLFKVLCAMGAYRPDSLEVRSRATGAQYVLNTFADGSISCAPHFRNVYEAWGGSFFRDEAYDAAALAGRDDIPDGHISLHETVAGHAIDFEGEEFLGYRLDETGAPVSLFVVGADGITVDGKKYTFADKAAKFQFAPVPEKYLSDGVKSAVLATGWTVGSTLTVPVSGEGAPQVLGCRDRIFDASIPVQHTWDGKQVTFTVTEELAEHPVVIFF